MSKWVVFNRKARRSGESQYRQFFETFSYKLENKNEAVAERKKYSVFMCLQWSRRRGKTARARECGTIDGVISLSGNKDWDLKHTSTDGLFFKSGGKP